MFLNSFSSTRIFKTNPSFCILYSNTGEIQIPNWFCR